MKIRIVADSSANLSARSDITSVPLHIVTAEGEYVDTAALDVAAMLRELAHYKGRTSTACPGVGDWLAAFDGADAVLGLTITGELSGAYNAACAAAAEYRRLHPDARIFILDSRTTGPEMQLLAEELLRLVSSDADFDAIVTAIQTYKKRTNLLFSLSSLNNFARNGRVNPALAKAIGLLGLRIVGMAKDGNLHPMHKPRGDKKAISQLVSSMAELGYAGGKVRISHTQNLDGAETLAACIRANYPDCDLTISHNGGLCCYYCEPGGVLLGFECG